MAQKSKSILKTYFESGDIPNSSQYHDLIESQLNLKEEGIQELSGSLSASSFIASNHITASGNISGSATTIISGQDLILDRHLSTSTISASGYILTNNITASGDISASGTMTSLDSLVETRLYFEGYGGGNTFLLKIGDDLTLSNGGLNVQSNITASGDISASNSSTASFGSLVLSNLPTTEPPITGALWLSGSGGGSASGSQYLMVFNP